MFPTNPEKPNPSDKLKQVWNETRNDRPNLIIEFGPNQGGAMMKTEVRNSFKTDQDKYGKYAYLGIDQDVATHRSTADYTLIIRGVIGENSAQAKSIENDFTKQANEIWAINLGGIINRDPIWLAAQKFLKDPQGKLFIVDTYTSIHKGNRPDIVKYLSRFFDVQDLTDATFGPNGTAPAEYRNHPMIIEQRKVDGGGNNEGVVFVLTPKRIPTTRFDARN